MPFQLRHIEGSKAGALDTFDQDRIRIGRQPDNDLPFDPQKDASVSGYHAEIYRDAMLFSSKTCRVATARLSTVAKSISRFSSKMAMSCNSRRADRKFHF